MRYLKGVVTVELSQNDSGEYNGVMTLQAYAADQQTAEKILNALLGRLDLIHDKAAAAVCSHSVRVIDQSVTQGVSTELRALQQTSDEDVQNLQSQLVELQSARQALDDNLASAKSTWESAEEPALGGGAASSVVKYLLIGFLLGGVLACGVVVVKFLLDGMVYSASELNRSTGLPVLGALASDRTKKAGKLDAKLYQMEGRPDGSADAEMLCLMAQTIRSRAPEAKNILVTGDLPADQLEALAAALQATEPLRGQSVTAAESILKAAATVPHVVAADAIVLAADCTGGFAVTISIKGGEEVAKRTFNPHIGVEGGLSVLGTSGIVEPMSQQAILDTIQLEMNQAALRAGSPRRLILAPGNYGLDYLHERYPEFHAVPVVKTSNFIGDTLDMAAAARFEEVLLVGHVGKLVKVAGGIMNTHSHTADCRTELFCTHAALCGASREVCAALMNAATTDACLELLDSAGLRAPVLESLLRAVQLHLDRRACGAFRVGAVLFSNQHGPLGATDTAAQLLNEWKEH